MNVKLTKFTKFISVSNDNLSIIGKNCFSPLLLLLMFFFLFLFTFFFPFFRFLFIHIEFYYTYPTMKYVNIDLLFKFFVYSFVAVVVVSFASTILYIISSSFVFLLFIRTLNCSPYTQMHRINLDFCRFKLFPWMKTEWNKLFLLLLLLLDVEKTSKENIDESK